MTVTANQVLRPRGPQIERITGKDTRVMEMYGTDPKSGKEFKMMEIALTRKSGAAPVSRAN